MNIPILIEPIPNGFRASTGAPLNWSTEAATSEAATTSLRERLSALLATGARVVTVEVPEVDPALELAAQLGANPFMEDWANAIRELREERRKKEAEEDILEAMNEERNGPASPKRPSVEPAA